MDITLFAIIGDDVDDTVVVDAAYYTDGTVYPTAFKVIFDKDGLCSRFQGQFLSGGQATFGKVAVDLSLKHYRIAREFGKFPFIDGFYRIAARSQSDV